MTTPEFKRWKWANLASKSGNFVNKTDFDNN